MALLDHVPSPSELTALTPAATVTLIDWRYFPNQETFSIVVRFPTFTLMSSHSRASVAPWMLSGMKRRLLEGI